jgi:hypothetical protein
MYKNNNAFSNTETLLYVLIMTVIFMIIAPITISQGNHFFGYKYGGHIGFGILLLLPVILLYYKQRYANNKTKNN